MAGNASIVVDIKAQITGYEEQIAKIKQAMKTIDPGSAIGKNLVNSLRQADQKLAELQRKAEQRVGSQGQLEGLFDSLRQMNDLVNNMGQGLSNVGMNDMLETSSDKAKQLGQELATIKNEMSIKGQTFLDSLKKDMDVKAFQSLFDQLQLNPEKMGIDEFVKKFDEATSDATKKVEDLTAAQEKAQSAAENATKLAGLRQQLPLKYQGTGPIKKGMVESDLNMGKFISQSQEQARVAADNFLNQVRTGLELDSKDDKTAGALNDILNKTADNLIKAKNETDIRNALTKLNTAIMTNTRGQGDKDIAGLTGGISIEDWVTKLTGKVQADQEFISKVQSIADTLSSPQASEGIRGFGEKISGLLQEVANPSDITTFETNMKQLVEAMHKGLNQLRTETNQATKEAKPGLVEDLTKQLEVAKGTLTNLEQVKNNPAYADFRELVNGFMQRLSRVEQALGLENKTTKEDNMAAAHKAGEQAMAHAEQKGGQNASMLHAYSTELDRVNQKTQLLGKVQGVIQRWFSIYAVVRMVGKAFRSITNNVKELDDTMTEIAIVTNKSQADLWKQMPQYTEMARKYGSSISGVYKVSQLYYQQGLNQADVMKLSEETLKMARISGLDYAQATDYMTNAIRSFKMEMTDAQKVVDVYSAVSASSATNTSELAAAMSKTASSAQAVGSDFESTTAMMAVMIEATRESPENIGSALKSIISRYGELKENVTGIDEEGEEYSLNKVDKALQTVGISIHDTNGEFRDFDDVITELSGKWDTIDKNTQRYIATVMAGNRQQSRFLALVSSGERLAELTETAMDSEDAATLQVLKTMDSISFKSQQVQTSLQSLYTSSGIENLMKGFLDIGNNIITTFTEMPTFLNLPIPAIGKLATTFTSLATTITTAFNIVKFNLQNQRTQWLAQEKAELEKSGQEQINKTNEIEQQKYSIKRLYSLRNKQNLTEAEAKELKALNGYYGKGGKGSTKLGMGLNIAGLAMSTISSSINAKNAGGRWAKGLTGIAGSALSMAGMGTMVAPGIGTAFGALAGTIMGVIENINTIAPSLESQLKDVQQQAETSRNNYLQKKDKYTSLDKEIDKLEKLKEARYDSAEANQAFLDASNSLASKYPELIDYIDEEGNAIINLTDKYTLLSAARMEAAQASTEASKDSVEYAEKAAQVAASQSKQQRRDAVANFKSRQLGEERASILSSAFGLKVNKATTGEKVLQKLFTSDQFKGTPIQSIAKILGSSESSEALKKLQNDKELLDQYSAYKASHTTSEDTVLFSYLDELIGKNTAIDQNIAQKNNAVKLANKNAISTAIYWENQGKLLDKETNASGFLENMSSSTALMNEYIYKNFEDWQARMEKDTSFQLGENETYYSRYQESQFAQDYADIYNELYNNLSPFSEEKQKNIDQLLNSLDSYTANDLFDILESDYKLTFGPDSKIREAIMNSYANMFGSEQFVSAIETREPESDIEMSEAIWGRIGDLSSKGYKAVLEQYDWINDQIDAKNIDVESGQQIFDSYTSLISGISEKFALDPKKRNAMLSKLYGADLTTLTGIDSLIAELQENGLTEEDIQELNFDTIKNLIPTNLSTELNSFQKKMTDGMSDYEKAISNASKGMDMKSAAEMAEKTGKTLSDFTLRDGKYFFEDYDAIQEAYLGDNAQYIQNLKDYAQKEQAKFEQIGKENQPIRRLDKSFDSIEEWATTNRILDLDKLAVKKSDLEAAFNEYKESDSTEDFFSEWIPSHYTQLVNDEIISANEYAKSVLLKSAMDSGKIKSIAKTALPKDATSRSIEALTGSLYEALRTGNFDRILKATNVSDELKNQLPQMKVAFDDARSSAVNSLVDSIDAGYKYIEANDYNKDVLQKMESQGLAKLQYRGDEIIGAVFENTTDNIDQIYEFIEDYAVPLGLMTEKEGREKRAQLKQQQYELTKSSTFSNLIKNYDNISQVMFEEFQSSWKIEDIEGAFKQQADGSYKANLPKLAQFAREHMSELDELAQQQIEETLTKAIDDGMTSITSASDYVTKGTTKYSDMTAFVKQFNEALPGAQATIQDLFGYDKDAQGYVLDPQKYRDYLAGQKQMLQAMGESTEYIDGLIQNANQSIYDAIDIKSYLDAESKGTKAEPSKARSTLKKQIMNANIRISDSQLYSESWLDYLSDNLRAKAEAGERIDPHAESTAKEYAEHFKQVNNSVREEAANQLIDSLDQGGIDAVNAMQAIATLQGKELTSADIESAYRAEVSQIENSFEQLIIGPGGIVTGTAKTILETLQSQGKASITALDANNAVVNSITDIAAAYQEYYNLLAQSGEATLESLNNAKAKVLETKDGRNKEQKAIDALGDAAGMTYSTFGQLMTDMGIELTDDLIDELESSGITEAMGGNKMRIKNFAAFARRMNWDFNSEEYLSAFSSFNDGLVEQNKKNKEQVNNELQNLKDSKPGDWINLTQTEKSIKKYSKEQINNTLSTMTGASSTAIEQARQGLEKSSLFNKMQNTLIEFGAYLDDGILKLSENANLLGVAETLKNTAIESGSEMSADLADMVDSIVNAYTDAITKGIEGGLTNTEKEDLRRKSSDLGVELTNEDFINAAEGFQLTTDKAIELYTRMGRLDTRQQKKIYKVLSQQLKDSNSQYKTATSMLSHIAEMQEEINKLRERGNEKDNKHIESLERELKLAKEMQMYALTHEDQSWNFMSNDAIPDSIDNALNYFQNWGQASKSLGEWSLSGKTDLNQFAALLQHVQEVADATGEAVDFMGVKVGKNATTYEDFLDNLYDMAEYNAQSGQWELNNTKMQQKLGFNMKLGSKGISTDLQTRIDQYADMNAQVLQDFDEFTGGLAAVYDTLHDYSEDNLGHSFEDFLDNGVFNYDKFEQQIKRSDKAWKAFQSFTDKVKINGEDWNTAMKGSKADFTKGSQNYNALMSVMKMALSENWDLESDYQAVAEQLEQSGFTGEVTLGDITIVASEGRTIIKKKGSNGKDVFIGPDGTEYETENEVIDAINRKALEDYQKSFEKYFKEGSDNNTIEIAGEEITVVIGKGKVTFKNANGDVISEGASMEEATKKAQQGMAKTNKLAGTATEEGWVASQSAAYKTARAFNGENGTGVVIQQAREMGQKQGLLTAEAVAQAYNKAVDSVATKNNADKNAKDFMSTYGEAIQAEMYSQTGLKLDASQIGVEMSNTDQIAQNIADQMNLTQTAADVMNGINAALSNPTTQTELGKAISGAFEAVTTDGVPAGEITINPTSVTVNTEVVQPEAVKDMTIPGGTITIVPTNTVVDAAAGAEAAEGGNQITIAGTVNYNNEFTKETPPEQTGGTAKYDKNQFTKETPPTLTGGTAVYTPTVEGSLPTLSGGVARYTAVIQGTKATGNVGLATGNAHAKSTLMGELGPEMVVSNGRYFVVGQNGPEFVDLADDAIVFNHLQTKSLLENGSSKTRGQAITNERKAVAYAHGNIQGGPAHDKTGGIHDAHNKYIGSSPVWNNGTDAIFNGVAKAGQAVEEALDAFIKKLDEWYNQLQEIAKIEEKITYQETLRSKIDSDLTKNGSAYYKSWAQSMLDLNDSIENNQALYLQQQDYLSKRISTLNSENSPWSKLYTLDSEGQVKYKDGMKEVFGEKFGATDANKPNYTPQEQYNWLISQGFGEFLKYDSNGKEIEFTDKEGKENQGAYKTAVESFWKAMEDELTEVQDLKDSIDEHQKAVLEAQQKQNELLQEMRDNQMELENKVLDAIVESREREIDEMEKTKDVYSEYSDKLVNGLTDALNKERDMYQMQDDQAETDKMRRRLAILQSSGGSASEIIDLQEQIRQRDRDMYFEEQEKQINAIKEASDLEIERMDEQISLEKEVLEYQKTYGLLWQQVYDQMVKSPQEIADFIKNNTEAFWGASPVKSAEDLDDVLYSAQKWQNYRDGILGDSGDSISNKVKIIADSILTNDGKKEWENFVAALNQTYGKDFTNDEELLNAYLAKYKETSDPNQAAAAAKAILQARGTKTAAQEAAEAAAAAQGVAASSGGSGSGGKSNSIEEYYDWDAPDKRDASAAKLAQYNSGTYDFSADQAKIAENRKKTQNAIDAFAAKKAEYKKQQKQLNRVRATGNAFAKGTLLGELGPEAWIANGKFHIAGQYGAEMVNLPDDAIVFNHQQTARLLRTGKAGRGNAINGEDAALGNKERNSYISTFWDQVARNRASMESINYPSYATSSSLEHISNELQNNNTNEAITIEHAEVNMNVEQLANDYDAKRAGEQALQEMLRIARKGSATTLRR